MEPLAPVRCPTPEPIEPDPPAKPQPPKSESKTFPRMPISDYVNPHRLCREIDQLLAFDEDYEQVEDLQPSYYTTSNQDSDPDDMVLISTPKDFLEIVTSVEEGPLRYRGVNLRLPSGLSSFSRRKRKNNRTGWPSVPRRRRTSNIQPELGEGDEEEEEDEGETTTCSISNETEADAEEDSRRTPIDITQRLQSAECSIGSGPVSDAPFRGKFTEFTSVEGRGSCVFTSSSDKAENSDIFTVSSDSLDTADLTAVATIGSSGIASGSQISQPVLTPEDDESSSIDVTLAELMETTKLETSTKSVVHQFNGTEVGKKNQRRNSVAKSSSSVSRRLHVMQPVIRVKKMSTKMMLATAAQRERNRMLDTHSLPGHKTPPPHQASSSSSMSVDQRVVTITGSGRKSIGRQSCSPKAKFSPPKLRKPRGRWYRER